jgi:type II secretory pathway pseudopilin PulG
MSRICVPGRSRAGCRCGAGLTLIEMLVVIGVIVLLASLVVSMTRHVGDQSKERALSYTFSLLKGALREYYEFKDVFPDANGITPVDRAAYLYAQLDSVPASRRVLQQISQALVRGSVDPPDPMKVYDPWGVVIDYRYKSGDAFPELISAGPDKTFGTPDDISSRNM